jgi:hypothetical protein
MRFLRLLVINFVTSNALVTILTTIQRIPDVMASSSKIQSDHNLEILLVLGENARARNVREVVVLVDDHPSVSSVTLDLQAAILLAALHFDSRLRDMRNMTGFVSVEENFTNRSSLNIRAFVVGAQPTYASLLRWANNNIKGIVALSNADVFLPHLDQVDEDAFKVDPPLALALSITKPPAGCGDDICPTIAMGWSWDVHVILFPLVANLSLLEHVPPFPVYMNAMGAENRVGHMLAAAGFELRNPCGDVVAYHWHCAKKTHAAAVAPMAGSDRAAKARGRGANARARVDAVVTDAAMATALTANLRRWNVKGGALTTRYFWVGRSAGGRGVVASSTAKSRTARRKEAINEAYLVAHGSVPTPSARTKKPSQVALESRVALDRSDMDEVPAMKRPGRTPRIRKKRHAAQVAAAAAAAGAPAAEPSGVEDEEADIGDLPKLLDPYSL